MTEHKVYRVCFIDGHDLKYKVFTTEAENREQAIIKMREMYGSNFEHRITGVYLLEKLGD